MGFGRLSFPRTPGPSERRIRRIPVPLARRRRPTSGRHSIFAGAAVVVLLVGLVGALAVLSFGAARAQAAWPAAPLQDWQLGQTMTLVDGEIQAHDSLNLQNDNLLVAYRVASGPGVTNTFAVAVSLSEPRQVIGPVALGRAQRGPSLATNVPGNLWAAAWINPSGVWAVTGSEPAASLGTPFQVANLEDLQVDPEEGSFGQIQVVNSLDAAADFDVYFTYMAADGSSALGWAGIDAEGRVRNPARVLPNVTDFQVVLDSFGPDAAHKVLYNGDPLGTGSGLFFGPTSDDPPPLRVSTTPGRDLLLEAGRGFGSLGDAVLASWVTGPEDTPALFTQRLDPKTLEGLSDPVRLDAGDAVPGGLIRVERSGVIVRGWTVADSPTSQWGAHLEAADANTGATTPIDVPGFEVPKNGFTLDLIPVELDGEDVHQILWLFQQVDPLDRSNRILKLLPITGAPDVGAETPSPTATTTRRATVTPGPSPTPEGDPGADVDLVIEAVEVNQAVQNLGNEAPLIAERPGVVRVYVGRDAGPDLRWDPDDGLAVTARIQATDGSWEELQPLFGPQAVLLDAAGSTSVDRGSLARSVNFGLPRMAAGSVTIEAHLNPNRSVAETNYSNNVVMRELDFEAARQPVAFARLSGESAPTQGQLERQLAAARQLLPVGGEPRVHDAGWLQLSDHHRFLGIEIGTLRQLMAAATNPAYPAQAVWAGVAGSLDSESFGSGITLVGEANLGATLVARDDRAAGLAHGFGHQLGRRHVACGPVLPRTVDGDYPYVTDTFATRTADGYWGFDGRGLTPVDPRSRADLMSLCPPVWPSDYTYRGVFERVIEPAPAGEAVQQMLVSGTINPDEPLATIGSVFVLEGHPVPPTDAGAYEAQLLDADGGVIAERAFDPSPLVGHVDPTGPPALDHFTVRLPFSPSAETVVIRHGSVEIARRERSPSAPEVAVNTLEGDLTQPFTLSWFAGDQDGDVLSYAVYFTSDGGQTWRQLVYDHREMSLEIDPSQLPGTDAGLFRVLVSDGFNHAMSTGQQAISIEPRAPEVLVLSPQNGASVPVGAPVHLEAVALDPETGQLPGAATSWTSDLDGALGTGWALSLWNLTPGPHRITASVTDDDGLRGERTITVVVGSRVYLPWGEKP